MPTRRRSALPPLALALSLFATLAAAGETKPARIVSTTPSVTGILLAMDAPLVASAATTPSRLTDAKGFFSQCCTLISSDPYCNVSPTATV